MIKWACFHWVSYYAKFLRVVNFADFACFPSKRENEWVFFQQNQNFNNSAKFVAHKIFALYGICIVNKMMMRLSHFSNFPTSCIHMCIYFIGCYLLLVLHYLILCSYKPENTNHGERRREGEREGREGKGRERELDQGEGGRMGGEKVRLCIAFISLTCLSPSLFLSLSSSLLSPSASSR